MERHFDVKLELLKKNILITGNYVEATIKSSTKAFLKKQPERLESVYKLENKINSQHIKIDKICVDLIATEAPVANDLRLIVAAIKINTDLERMGDLSVNIANTGKDYLQSPGNIEITDVANMAKIVRNMVKNSLIAFVNKDIDLAQSILNVDDDVDKLKRKVSVDYVDTMKKDPEAISICTNIIMIAKSIERIGDHATNIAESVIFAFTGKDIRHSANSL